MRYYAKYNDKDELMSVGISDADGSEITEAEYKRLLGIITEKAALVDALYRGEIAAGSIRTDWRDEIVRRVEERIEFEKEHDVEPDEIELKAQAYDIITGVSE